MKEMKDAMALLHQCLSQDEELLRMLGGRTAKYKRIYNNPKVAHQEELPRVTMQEIINEDGEFADDEPEVSDVVAKIDVWSKRNNCFAIAVHIKKRIRSKFRRCSVSLESDLYEEDTEIYHKPIKVYLKIEQENLL